MDREEKRQPISDMEREREKTEKLNTSASNHSLRLKRSSGNRHVSMRITEAINLNTVIE